MIRWWHLKVGAWPLWPNHSHPGGPAQGQGPCGYCFPCARGGWRLSSACCGRGRDSRVLVLPTIHSSSIWLWEAARKERLETEVREHRLSHGFDTTVPCSIRSRLTLETCCRLYYGTGSSVQFKPCGPVGRNS